MPPTDQEIVLEVHRAGRRPRYHRGARQAGTGVVLDPPQCNIDDAGGRKVLEALPEYPAIPRPWAQLCRRCYRGTPVLAAADTLRRKLGY
jgi:hypothetical protein